MKIISASIDLSKVKKEKIVSGKNGAKYYNIQIFLNDAKDQYGNDVSIKDGQTKEQREAKEKSDYIGNGKTIWEGNKTEPPAKTEPRRTGTPNDDLPF